MIWLRNISLLVAALVLFGAFGQPARSSEVVPQAVLDGNEQAVDVEVEAGPLRVRLQYDNATAGSDTPRSPVMELFVEGKRVKLIDDGGNGFEWPRALVQIVEMDGTNPYAEVVLSTYSGGAHCCNVRRILTSSEDGATWFVIEPEPVDGDMRGAEDADGDGVFEIVHPDNSFYYTFASYAGSFAPLQVFALRDRELVDVSADPRFTPLHRERLSHIQPMIDELAGSDERNGLLAGYVALKNLLGEGKEAWPVMLKLHNPTSDWGLSECTGGYDANNDCIKTTTYKDFPTALDAFLRQRGYID